MWLGTKSSIKPQAALPESLAQSGQRRIAAEIVVLTV